jgi:His/Glu/Gln/Arg/opine family amino acid ABC transporter permease subunit|tara:strand:+ start:762 stop:2597 length:1836 start_codon:yes stop_codon:yes gene_type:complete
MADNVNIQESPPEVQFAGVNRWLRENLFSSTGSAILTFVSIGALIGLFRSIIGFFISPEREWTAITYNLRLYMVQAYPESDFIRVWITIGLVMGLLGLTWGFNSVNEKSSLKSTGTTLMKVFSSLFLLVLIAPTSVVIDKVEGTVAEVFQQELRIYLLAVFAGLILVSYFIRTKLASQEVSKDYLNIGYVGLLVVSIWLIKVPTVTFDSSNVRIEPDPLLPLAASTKNPWTALYLLLVVTFFIGRYLNSKNLTSFKRILPVSWLLTPLVVVTWIYRKPDFTLSQITTLDLPVILGFSAIGYLVINYLNSEKLMQYQRYFVYGSLIIAVVVFSLPVLRQLKLLFFLLWILISVAPTIANSKESARSLFIVWSVAITILILLMRGGTSETLIVVPGSSIYGGFALTWVLAFFGIAISFPFGVMLALGRTSSLPIIRIICTAIIELVRSVPFITWLFFGSVMLTFFLPAGVEFDEVVRAVVVTSIFSAAYLAENVRGGLQSISKGQFEAADAVGLSTLQRISLIVMPQALRAVIPPIVSQVISLFKDTSLVAIVGLFDLLYIGSKVIPNQSQGANFLGTIQENILFCAIFYWIFTYSFARRSMKIEKRLGLGER